MEEKKLGGLIRQSRERKGISQEKLAEYVDVSRQAVSKWEKDLAAPTEENVRKIEEALDLSEGTLMEAVRAGEAARQEPCPRSPKWAILFMAVALAAGGAGFFAGRATTPIPEEAPAEPETKTIWRLTESHRENPNPYDSEERSTYDEQGRLVKRENLGSEADPTVLVTEFKYDEVGNCIERISYRDGELYWREEYGYDAMGNQTLLRSLLPDGTPEYWVEQTYDDRGNQTSYQKFDSDGKLVDSWRYTYKYHEDGSYEQDYFTPGGENTAPWHVVEVYDANGNWVSQTEYDMSGNVVRTWNFVYEAFEVPVDFVPEF